MERIPTNKEKETISKLITIATQASLQSEKDNAVWELRLMAGHLRNYGVYLGMATNAMLPMDFRAMMGLDAVLCCILEGNYPRLIALSEHRNLLPKTRKAAEEGINAAALNLIKKYASERQGEHLAEIEKDGRLDEFVRMGAKKEMTALADRYAQELKAESKYRNFLRRLKRIPNNIKRRFEQKVAQIR